MVDREMKLPAGLTCGDCIHLTRCWALFGHTDADTYCDWSPSRFTPLSAVEREFMRALPCHVHFFATTIEPLMREAIVALQARRLIRVRPISMHLAEIEMTDKGSRALALASEVVP